MKRPDDLSKLMRMANRGDARCYRALLETLAPRVRSFVRRRLGRIGRGHEDYEDIVQDTLLAIHIKRHTWDDQQPLGPWVQAIAHHKTIDALRRRGFREHLPLEDYENLLTTGIEPVNASVRECNELLTVLPERLRRIVQAISIEGRSAREIGDKLGMSEGAVRVALHRALKTLSTANRQEGS